ncbi:MAG TPA: OsmC family protein [Rhodopila sp.]|uniref:OsmC family protein n=1 Tax=Rhodopila sp. TaxID=2480087 RepID=UPI002BACD567|nr:OsmC family protein [Rhodopila sp.]HVY15330.1 OsmC family protein [Rhodopila sp.]
MKEHVYRLAVTWTGNRGEGTRTYAGYARDHVIEAAGKPAIPGSSDPAFRGDPARWNPEELLLASLSACHKLWYLHLCAAAKLVVLTYRDEAEAVMTEDASGAGRFVRAVLRPSVSFVAGADLERAAALHHDAHRYCFIANSVNFPVLCEPVLVIG